MNAQTAVDGDASAHDSNGGRRRRCCCCCCCRCCCASGMEPGRRQHYWHVIYREQQRICLSVTGGAFGKELCPPRRAARTRGSSVDYIPQLNMFMWLAGEGCRRRTPSAIIGFSIGVRGAREVGVVREAGPAFTQLARMYDTHTIRRRDADGNGTMSTKGVLR